MAVRRLRQLQKGVHQAIYRGTEAAPELDVSDRVIMRMSVETCIDIHDIVKDLKACILKNRTAVELVSSDDPSVFTSRFHIQKLNERTFGLGSSGALFFLPLTPWLLLLCYDGAVHTLAGKHGHYGTVDKPGDVFALNELQYLRAADNVYFSNWGRRDQILAEFDEVSPRRPESWSEISVLVPDGKTDDGEVFRMATDEEQATEPRRFVATSSIYPEPSRWLSKLRFRHSPRTYSDGSAAGHLRKDIWVQRQAIFGRRRRTLRGS